MKIDDKSRNWNLAVTRVFALFEIWMATEVYPKFPIKKGGFNMDTIVIGSNGLMERYLVQDQLDEFGRIAVSNDFVPLLSSFTENEEAVLPFFDRDPYDNREEFIKVFRQLWIHEITSFFLGLYVTDQKAIDIISNLRGTKSAQHVATTTFLPKLYKQIALSLNIDEELIKYALPDEIISLNLDPDILALRQKQYVIESVDGARRLLVGDEAINYITEFKKNIKSDIQEPVLEFKGSPAFQGKATGKAVVILNENDLVNVNEGDILVSPMTRTSFLPAMKRAAAYVTDEGGVTCHAAIVARELQKPCVVGTKVASKVLKNGMQVEVDAVSGNIKILDKNE